MDLTKFARYVDDNFLIQEEVKNCKNGNEFLLLLRKYKCENLFDEIKSRALDLSASYWPWAYETSVNRKKYFDLDIDKK